MGTNLGTAVLGSKTQCLSYIIAFIEVLSIHLCAGRTNSYGPPPWRPT